MTGETSKVLTLVFTDLADSTALKTEHGDQAVDELITRHREHVAGLADECAGRVIDWAGDGCFLTFDTSSAGVMFALRLQKAHADESDLPAVRIGIHLGEVTEKDGPDNTTYVKGLAVDVAARVQGLAKPGQVLMSSAVYNSAKQRMGVDTLGQPILWQLHGLYDLKGFDHPLEIGEAGLEGISSLEAPKSAEKARLVRSAKTSRVRPVARVVIPMTAVLVILALLAGAVYFADNSRGEADPSATIEKIAVLPFENLSNDPEQAFFTDGITEALIFELRNIGSLRVISSTSSNRYKDTNKSLSEIARELDVDALVTGTVLKAGNNVRITAELLRPGQNEAVWDGWRESALENWLKLQGEVALSMVEEIRTVVTPAERARIEAIGAVDPEAFVLAAQGRHFLDRRDKEGFDRGRELFEKALKIDPDFHLARAGLADSYLIPVLFGYTRAEEGFPRAEAEIRRALAGSSDLGEAHASRGYIELYYKWDWDAAEASLLRAIELSPNYGGGYDWYGDYLMAVGRYAEALDYDRKGFEVDPLSPEQAADVGLLMWMSGDAESAVSFLEEVEHLYPDVAFVQRNLSDALRAAGHYELAIRRAERAIELTGRTAIWTLEVLALLYAEVGRTEEARGILEEMEAVAGKSGFASRSRFAVIRANLGDWDEGLKEYEEAFRTRDPWLVYLRTYADFWLPADFVSDPRFQDLLRRMNFPDREMAN